MLRFVLEAVLTQGSQVIRDGDPAIAGVPFAWRVRSPARLADSDFAVRVDGNAVPFSAIAEAADTTGRTWTINVPNSFTAAGHTMEIDVGLAEGGVTRSVQFELGTSEFALRDVFPFPNPFREGTTINFFLTAGGPSDVRARIFTVSGSLVYERTERGLSPGYHQWVWDGRDASGKTVAMGTYIVRVAAVQGDGGREAETTTKLVRAPLSTSASGSP